MVYVNTYLIIFSFVFLQVSSPFGDFFPLGRNVGNIVIDGKGSSTQENEAALKQRKAKEAQRKQYRQQEESQNVTVIEAQ